MLHRAIGLAVLVLALVVGVFGVFTAAVGQPKAGVALNGDPVMVTGVQVGSVAWRDGIRPGDTVLELHASIEPGGWRLFVRDPNGDLLTTADEEQARLRETLLPASVGLGLTLLAALLVLSGSAAGYALVPIALALAARPLLWMGIEPQVLIGGLATFVTAGIAVALVTPRTQAIVALVVGAGLGAAWLVSLAAAPATFDAFAVARIPIAGAFTLVGGWFALDRRALAKRLLSPTRVGVFDLVYLPTVLAVLAGAVLFLRLSALVAGVILALALAVYPAGRRAVAAAAERLIVGDLRHRAELRAIEAERGRMAREIHDAPLQELAAVIRRLEARPDTAGETGALREVAASLRGVASALHPPVLEDLGLAAAIADLGEQVAADHPERTVTVHVDDLVATGPRPDPEAEVAAFRIVQEALTNAVRHSTGREVTVEGAVGVDTIELEIRDTGTGLEEQAVVNARRAGHFGLDSMRERALAVDGTLEIDSEEDGVCVRFTWERPT